MPTSRLQAGEPAAPPSPAPGPRGARAAPRVGDAGGAPRVRGDPSVEELGVVACLAVPLALPDGRVVGALCAVDRVPRAWTAEEAAAPEPARERPGRLVDEFEQATVALEETASAARERDALAADEARRRFDAA